MKSAPRPPISEFGSVDPAPPAPEHDVPALRQRLLDLRRPLFERFKAIFALRNLNTDASAFALGEAMVGDKSALLRHECAYVLGQMQREASVPQLIQALESDPNPMVRHEAAEALGAIGGERVIPLLHRALENDPAVEVRESCQLALDHILYLEDPNQL